MIYDYKNDFISTSSKFCIADKHKNITEENPEKILEIENNLSILIEQAFHALHENEAEISKEKFICLIDKVSNKGVTYYDLLLKIQNKKKFNLIEQIMNLVVNPYFEDQLNLYIKVLTALLTIDTTEIAKVILNNHQFIDFLNSVMFLSDDPLLLESILYFIALLAHDMAELKIKFSKIFPSFNYDRIVYLFNTFREIVDQVLILAVKNIIDSQVYGEFYRELLCFLMNNFNINFDPTLLFQPLINYVKKYPGQAFEDIMENNFLYGILFDFCLFPKIHKNNWYLFNQYSLYSMKFLKACMKVRQQTTDEILNNLPVDDLIDFIFSQNSIQDENMNGNNNENWNLAVFRKSKILAMKLLYLDAQKPTKSWILKLLCDNSNDEKLCFLVINEGFQLKLISLQLIILIIQTLDTIKNNDFSFTFLRPDFINSAIDLLFSNDEKLIEQILIFLEILFTKAILINVQSLIRCLKTEYVMNSIFELTNHESFEISTKAQQLWERLSH
ncbi:hypothetical protein TRFO_38425 [Tritrichomonas foetus]|uniref:Uncharacterized protein n=1 Tax=Tritrichomonas foetus TaxID=1144522 RepID=A0A1J4J9X9_9EUKA|nr:hypothetical protein TRFO_38425 [Tritrichomonas foetus]|eukprot:OHS95473.1 hypothetical protein TRFO_38425 [Tritrichomonas foetus]